jgi:hypothetical protein
VLHNVKGGKNFAGRIPTNQTAEEIIKKKKGSDNMPQGSIK